MIFVEKKFDELIGGGISERGITQIYGPSASGKTNIALIASINCALKHKKVFFVDPEGGFSVERLKQIAKEKTDEVLRNIVLVEPTTYDEQKVAVKKIEEMAGNSEIGLIVIDSIAMLYRLEDSKEKQIDLGRQLEGLLRVARKYNIAVLITNQVYTDINSGNVMPVGGDLIKYWTKVIVELKKDGNERIAVLKKHKFLEEGKKIKFKIINSGILTEDISTSDAKPNSTSSDISSNIDSD